MSILATDLGAPGADPGPIFRLETEAACVRCSGELDLATAPQLERAVRGLAARGATAIEVDLARIEFMDCAGLGTLVALAEQAERAPWTISITAMSLPVARLIALTGSSRPFAAL